MLKPKDEEFVVGLLEEEGKRVEEGVRVRQVDGVAVGGVVGNLETGD